MEVQVDLVISFFKNERRLLKIKNFEFSLWKDEEQNKTVEDIRVHIKYIKVKEKDGLKLFLERTDFGEKITLKISNETDLNNIKMNIIREQKNYENFLNEYYTNNNSYNLIDGDSFFDYFQKVIKFLDEMEKNLDNIQIDENLEMILTMQDDFLHKIESYKNIIDTNISKLTPNEQNQNELIQQTQEIKNLIEELSDVIKSCTYNLNVSEIQSYINNFKNVVRQKSKEIIMLIDEIKYNLSNYLALKSENPDEKAYTDIFNSKEEEISKLLLENENLKIQIENFETENEIIEEYLKENGEKIN
jgi:hypothetical protein